MDKKLFLPEMQTMPTNCKGGDHDYVYSHNPNSVSQGQTPSQTVGPFFAYSLVPQSYGYNFIDLTNNRTYQGAKEITIVGQVLDGKRNAVHDALVEIFQADAQGKYQTTKLRDSNSWSGFARCGTGSDGLDGKKEFQFFILKPASSGKSQAPCINLVITMRGLLNHLFTRMYFEDEDNSTDIVLQQLPQERRSSLIAKKIAEKFYRFDIYLQGEQETIFFDL